MIIFRLKEIDFSRRDEFPNKLREAFDSPDPVKTKIIVNIERTSEFDNQYKKSMPGVRARIDNYIKELKKNPLSRFEDAGNSFADTHYLSDFSNISTSNTKDQFLMFSKKLNVSDRFNYRIYKPETQIVEETGEELLIQKIVLSTCQGHTISGKPGSYVGGSNTEGNVYHPVSKAEKRRRKEEKRQKQQNKKQQGR